MKPLSLSYDVSPMTPRFKPMLGKEAGCWWRWDNKPSWEGGPRRSSADKENKKASQIPDHVRPVSRQWLSHLSSFHILLPSRKTDMCKRKKGNCEPSQEGFSWTKKAATTTAQDPCNWGRCWGKPRLLCNSSLGVFSAIKCDLGQKKPLKIPSSQSHHNRLFDFGKQTKTKKRQEHFTQTFWTSEQFFLLAFWLIFFLINLKKKGILVAFFMPFASSALENLGWWSTPTRGSHSSGSPQHSSRRSMLLLPFAPCPSRKEHFQLCTLWLMGVH